MHWESAAATDRGRRRSSNEDAFVVRPELGFFVVADGMGGHAAGEVASRMAADTVTERFLAARPATLSAGDLEAALATATSAANRAIFERGEREPDKAGMGTTLTALALLPDDGAWRIAHVGDSRAYRLRGGELTQLTTDHTWVQQQVDLGRLRPAEARGHPFANIVTRALGIGATVEVDLEQGDARPGDVFLLCSDGLSGMVTDRGIARMLAADLPPDAIVTRLVAAANRAGGDDNITAVVARIVD
ncbi:MAG TPA: Stp1/IreP family PP2C-type Ser/Thr phosphatase [Longimicrobiales bacterium]|nr:Stp1/IreP family PP2C-type Ser/Thr phosphatase [Longimicrobiales bacterium]